MTSYEPDLQFFLDLFLRKMPRTLQSPIKNRGIAAQEKTPAT